jgi:hypothetical protein
MTEKLVQFLEEKNFRELENYIEEHKYDISSLICCKIGNREYIDTPFFNIASDVGDLDLIKFILDKNVIPSIFSRYDAFMEACRDGCIGVVELFLQMGNVTDDKKNHAMRFMNMDFEIKNKKEIIECLLKHGAKC